MPIDPIFAALTAGVAAEKDAVKAIILSQDNLFAALQAALANPVPAEALAAVQAAIDSAKENQDDIVAAIARDTVIPPPQG